MFYKKFINPEYQIAFDRDGKLSYEAIRQILKTVGIHHSDHAGDNVIDGSQNGIEWILSDWRVQITRCTDSKEALYATTWVHGKAPASIAFHNFTLTSGNGNVLIRAETKFALLFNHSRHR